MINLTFGEQVKIVLSRKDMTIKELAEEIEARTGKKMSRQNLTQRLGRDNFQEQDMRMIADILGCPFQLSILGNADSEKDALDEEEMPTGRELEKLTAKKERKAAREEAKKNVERDITVGEIVDILEETTAEPFCIFCLSDRKAVNIITSPAEKSYNTGQCARCIINQNG